MSSNSYGNDNRGVRKFLRQIGVAPTVANVERIGREVRRTESQNRQVESIAKEREKAYGLPSTIDNKGDVHKRVRESMKRKLANRPQPR